MSSEGQATLDFMYLKCTYQLLSISVLSAHHTGERDVSSQAIAKMKEKNEDILSVAFHRDISAQIL